MTMTLANVLVADWGRNLDSRVTYLIEVSTRAVTRVEPPAPASHWTVETLVEVAGGLAGSTLVLIDVAIGLPRGLFSAMKAETGGAAVHLVDLLRATVDGGWFGAATSHEDWSVRAPYVRVPKGDGSLRAFKAAAESHGVQLWRAIDVETSGRSPLILSGIPGAVGYGSRDVLSALGRLDHDKVAVWPFDGALGALLGDGRVVVGEIYPRALYAHALSVETSEQRSRLALGKTNLAVRDAAIAQLKGLEWPKGFEVELSTELLDRARKNEDDFDAYMSALGLLRLLLENVPLEDASLVSPRSGGALVDRVAEGGMLGVLGTQLQRGQQAFVVSASAHRRETTAKTTAKPSQPKRSGSTSPSVRVTSGILSMRTDQIACTGLPTGSTSAPLWVEINCQGRPYTLVVKDTTSIWRVHQEGTAEDFDALYALLSGSPDQPFPVDVVNSGSELE